MSWIPGTPLTISADDTAQVLTGSSPGLVAAIRFQQFPSNNQRFFWGDSTLNVTNLSGGAPAPSGILGYLDPPVLGVPSKPDFLAINENNVGTSIDPGTVYIEGKQGQVVLWSYKQLSTPPLVIRSGTAQAGSGNTITLDASASATDNDYRQSLIVIVAGTGAGQSANMVRSYVGSTKVATMVKNWAINPDSTSLFAVLAWTSPWDEVTADHLTSGTTGASLNAAGSSGDPWATTIPGAYGSGTAGFIVGNRLDANVSSRMATFVLPTNFNLLSIDVNGRLDLSRVLGQTINALISGKLDAVSSVRSGVAQAGASTTITLDSGASAVDNYYRNSLIMLVGGTGAGQVAKIRSYVGSTKVATIVAPAWAVTPDNTSVFTVLPATSPWDEITADHLASGSTGSSLNSSASAGDPWSTAIPGSYGSGTAGNLVGNNLNAPVSSVPASVWNAVTTGFTTVGTFGNKVRAWLLGSDSGALVSTDQQNLGTSFHVDITSVGGSANAAARLALSAAEILPATVDASNVTPTTTVFESSSFTTLTPNLLGNMIIFTSGSLNGQRATVTGYSINAGRGHFTVTVLDGQTALPAAPTNGMSFIVV